MSNSNSKKSTASVLPESAQNQEKSASTDRLPSTYNDQAKIEAIYYLLTGARRLEEGTSTDEDWATSLAQYGKVLLGRELTAEEKDEINENR